MATQILTILGGGLGDDFIDGASGSDQVSYYESPSAVTVNLTTGSATGGDGNDTLLRIESISGSTYNDILIGDSNDNNFKGNAGNDIIDGRSGFDFAVYSVAPASVTVNLTLGTAKGGDGDDTLKNIEGIIGSAYDDIIEGDEKSNTIGGYQGTDIITGRLGDDSLDGGIGIDLAVFSGNSSAYTIKQTSTGNFTISGPDGTDTLTNIEVVKFDDKIYRLLPGSGTKVDFTLPINTNMLAIRDFDGNDLGSPTSWKLIGSAIVNNGGLPSQILINPSNGRWAEVTPQADGLVYFSNFGWAGDTRVVGIYIDPEVTAGNAVKGGPNDSQRRFQNDITIGNLAGVLGGGDYNKDGLQEVYFSITDGTAVLHAYMWADGNIQYANYQSIAQAKSFLTSNGFGQSTWGSWSGFAA